MIPSSEYHVSVDMGGQMLLQVYCHESRLPETLEFVQASAVAKTRQMAEGLMASMQQGEALALLFRLEIRKL